MLDSEGFEIIVDKKNGLTMPLNESKTTFTKGGLWYAIRWIPENSGVDL